MEYTTITFSAAESRDLEEMLGGLRHLYDPHMEFGMLVDAIYARAVDGVKDGSLDAEEMRAIVTDIIAEDITSSTAGRGNCRSTRRPTT